MPALLAIPEVDVALLAIIAILFLLAFEPVRRFISHFLSGLPVIGGTVAGWVEGALTDVYNWIANYLNGLSTGIVDFFKSLWVPFDIIATEIAYLFEAVYGAINKVISQTIPAVVDWILTAVSQSLDTLKADLTQAINAVAATTLAALDSIVQWATTAFNQIEAFTEHLYSVLEATISYVANDIVAWVQSSLWSLVTTIYGALGDVISWATSAFAALIAQTETLIGDVTSWVGTEIAVLSGAIATGLSDVEAWVTSLFTTAISEPLSKIWDQVRTPAQAVQDGVAVQYPDIASLNPPIPVTVPLDISAAITGLAAITVPLTQYVEQCGLPLCKNLGNYGKLLNELEGVLGSGLFLAFVVSAATDPAGTATVTHDVVDPIVKPIVDAMKGIL